MLKQQWLYDAKGKACHLFIVDSYLAQDGASPNTTLIMVSLSSSNTSSFTWWTEMRYTRIRQNTETICGGLDRLLLQRPEKSSLPPTTTAPRSTTLSLDKEFYLFNALRVFSLSLFYSSSPPRHASAQTIIVWTTYCTANPVQVGPCRPV